MNTEFEQDIFNDPKVFMANPLLVNTYYEGLLARRLVTSDIENMPGCVILSFEPDYKMMAMPTSELLSSISRANPTQFMTGGPEYLLYFEKEVGITAGRYEPSIRKLVGVSEQEYYLMHTHFTQRIQADVNGLSAQDHEAFISLNTRLSNLGIRFSAGYVHTGHAYMPELVDKQEQLPSPLRYLNVKGGKLKAIFNFDNPLEAVFFNTVFANSYGVATVKSINNIVGDEIGNEILVASINAPGRINSSLRRLRTGIQIIPAKMIGNATVGYVISDVPEQTHLDLSTPSLTPEMEVRRQALLAQFAHEALLGLHGEVDFVPNDLRGLEQVGFVNLLSNKFSEHRVTAAVLHSGLHTEPRLIPLGSSRRTLLFAYVLRNNGLVNSADLESFSIPNSQDLDFMSRINNDVFSLNRYLESAGIPYYLTTLFKKGLGLALLPRGDQSIKTTVGLETQRQSTQNFINIARGEPPEEAAVSWTKLLDIEVRVFRGNPDSAIEAVFMWRKQDNPTIQAIPLLSQEQIEFMELLLFSQGYLDDKNGIYPASQLGKKASSINNSAQVIYPETLAIVRGLTTGSGGYALFGNEAYRQLKVVQVYQNYARTNETEVYETMSEDLPLNKIGIMDLVALGIGEEDLPYNALKGTAAYLSFSTNEHQLVIELSANQLEIIKGFISEGQLNLTQQHDGGDNRRKAYQRLLNNIYQRAQAMGINISKPGKATRTTIEFPLIS